ncbi:MAG: iron transporter FeoB [Oscillochloris sp.]|nr:iron transporter FeoB [Oscillochloris sp.]
MPDLTIALAGNPNVGKSTVFNALTGMRQHVGNWPGKTVERKEGQLTLGDYTVTIVDLPGTYSLAARSLEEQIARDFIVRERPHAVINVIDMANLERNLYLTAQLLETDVTLVVVLNMADVAAGRELKVNPQVLAADLDAPVVMMTASKGDGIAELKATLATLITTAAARPALQEIPR